MYMLSSRNTAARPIRPIRSLNIGILGPPGRSLERGTRRRVPVGGTWRTTTSHDRQTTGAWGSVGKEGKVLRPAPGFGSGYGFSFDYNYQSYLSFSSVVGAVEGPPRTVHAYAHARVRVAPSPRSRALWTRHACELRRWRGKRQEWGLLGCSCAHTRSGFSHAASLRVHQH